MYVTRAGFRHAEAPGQLLCGGPQNPIMGETELYGSFLKIKVKNFEMPMHVLHMLIPQALFG